MAKRKNRHVHPDAGAYRYAGPVQKEDIKQKIPSQISAGPKGASVLEAAGLTDGQPECHTSVSEKPKPVRTQEISSLADAGPQGFSGPPEAAPAVGQDPQKTNIFTEPPAAGRNLGDRTQKDTGGRRESSPEEECEEICREDYLIVKKTALRGAAIFFLYLFFLAAAVYAAYRAGYHMAVIQSEKNILML